MTGPWAKKGLAMFRDRAEKLARNPAQAGRMLDEAVAKAGKSRELLNDVRDQFQALVRLLRAVFKGDYKQVPWTSLVTGVAALLYFVNPLDLIPDFIVGVGLLDDVTVIAFALNAIKGDLEVFRAWEEAKDEA